MTQIFKEQINNEIFKPESGLTIFIACFLLWFLGCLFNWLGWCWCGVNTGPEIF